MTLNIEALRKAVEWAEKEAAKGDDGLWDQTHWAHGEVSKRVLKDEHGERFQMVKVACGTAFCVAGNICATQGDRFVLYGDSYAPGTTISVEEVMPKGSKDVFDIGDRARDILGVNVSGIDDGIDYYDLFDGDNTIEDVRRIATHIAAKHGYEL